MTDVPINFVDHKAIFRDECHEMYEDGVLYVRDLPPASAVWMRGTDDTIGSLWFTCPCGCGAVTAVTVNSRYGKAWAWNGSEDKPTTTPSILRLDGCRWHGYLTDGVFRPC